jgi:hypothetical protein
MTHPKPRMSVIEVLAEDKAIADKLSGLSAQIAVLCELIERTFEIEDGLKLERQVIALAKSIKLHADAVDDLSTFLTN